MPNTIEEGLRKIRGDSRVGVPRRLDSPAHRHVGGLIRHRILGMNLNPASDGSTTGNRSNTWLHPETFNLEIFTLGVVLPVVTRVRRVTYRGYRDSVSDLSDCKLLVADDVGGFTELASLSLSGTGWSEDTDTMNQLVDIDNFIYIQVSLDSAGATLANSRALWIDIFHTPTSLIDRT